MSLNSIPLPSILVQDLYAKVLVEFKENPAIEDIPAEIKNKDEKKPVSSWLGENKKNILVLVKYPGLVHLPDNQLKFLTGMLTACKLGLADVAVLNLQDHSSITYKELTQTLKPRIILLFGISPGTIDLPVDFPAFQLQPFNNITYLQTPSLDELESDKVLKSKLWVCLRRLFNV